MDTLTDILTRSDEQIEEWFLGALNEAGAPLTELSAVVDCFARKGRLDKAEACAELLQDAFLARRIEEPLLALMRARAGWKNGDATFAAVCRQTLTAFYEKDEPAKLALANAGFDKPLKAGECLSRLAVLRRLKPGVLCYDKGWGVGVVKELDAFGRQVVIDFDARKGHRMALAYAGECLEIPGETHLLTLRHRDPAALEKMAWEQPGAVVKIAIASFGPLQVPRLQEIIGRYVLSADQWKKFWDAARKQLKDDLLVELPARTSEPIRLRATARAYDDAWFGRLAEERDMEQIVGSLDELGAAATLRSGPAAAGLRSTREPAVSLDGKRTAIVTERLSFVMRGCTPKQAGLKGRALLVASDFGLLEAGPFHEAVWPYLLSEAALMALPLLPARKLKPFLALLLKATGDTRVDRLLEIAVDFPYPVLSEIAEWLDRQGKGRRYLDKFKSLFAQGAETASVILWAAKNIDLAFDEGICSPDTLAGDVMSELEKDSSGERLKAKNQLRQCLGQNEWLTAVLERMDSLARREWVRRVKQSTAWPPADQRSVLARLIRLFPDVEDVVVAVESDAPVPAGRFTSLRSHEERRQQLAKIVNEDIPRNSKDIGVARSYGDLRENFEYKTAKEMQGILMRRKAELEVMLTQVRQTDFSNCSADVAGMGTSVTLRYADGHEAQIHILGEWDSMEAMGILSCQTKVAQILQGHKPGDRVMLPAEKGEEPCEIVAVSGLPEAIRAWALGSP
ncbi:MAG: GreA/GreB family elongation factor [Lentisphaerae bacterium]|nr:GreA/GreB family elongation factor [Lentisphaerota bacterium]